MGQSSSKRQDTSLSSDTADSPNPVAGASTDLHPDSARDPGDDSSSSQPGSPRSPSIRKSILNFVKPSNIRSRVSSIASQPGDVRRSWRNSIRRQKDSPPTSSSASSTAGPSTTSLSPTDKGKKPERNDSDDEDIPTPVDLDLPIEQFSSPIPLPASEMQQDIQTTPEILTTAESLEAVAASPVDDEINTLYVSDPGEPQPEQQPPVYHREGAEPVEPPQPQQSSSPPQPTPRQFPPPGTLVVVQGIVHTTDVSRTNNQGTDSNYTSTSTLRPAPTTSETSGESGTSRTRNRLSALLRPRSTSSRPSSTINDSVPSVTITPPAEPDLPISSSVEPEVSEELTSGPADALQDQPPPLEEPPPLPTHHPHQTPSISSSSIDVLGTLLSVAAAATAASLLTGSSEPILSSGLAPPNPSIPSTSNNAPPTPNTPLADISAAGRAERMRHAWGTIRERLGLRPSAPPSEQDTNVPVVPPTTATPTPTTDPTIPISLPDTRELMLAEMTRAFNVGFGLNGSGLGGGLAASGNVNNQPEGEPAVTPDANDTYNNQESTDSGTPPSATLPPEGSFDRFLMDLQIDLRTALTQVEDPPPTPLTPPQGRRSTTSEPVQPQEAEAGTENTNEEGSSSTPHSPSETQRGTDQHEDHHPHPQGSPEGIHAVNVDSDRPSMPDLSDIYDTDSEFEDAEEDPYDDDFHSARHASNPGLNNPPRTPTLGAGRIDASGRINWWRLYRFPPVMPPRLDMANFRQSLVPTVPSPMTSSTAALETLPSTSATADPASSSDPAPSPSPTSIHPPQIQNQEPPTQQAVVPVIVVGLQSVNSDWRPDMPPPDENDMDVFGHPHGVGGGAEVGGGGHETFGEDNDFDGFGNNTQHPELIPDEAATGTAGRGRGLGRGRGRARGWQSRAANAIRNLRPGRRPPPPGTQYTMTTPGSRTFLIYVIGGYYPPDHTIVTGGPNNLDSFEALLELADLLGQVKPPTVSKDDIEKSGLEIIKAAQLSQKENDGKVSSNCLDRCLICLDDYQPEEDIRIMTCRHAFHKTCVDEWLQTGRNNCPACRTTGVTPGIGTFTSPPRV